ARAASRRTGSSLVAPAAQQDIERAAAAMAGLRRLDPQHACGMLAGGKPPRHMAAQYAAAGTDAALAGNDQQHALAVAPRLADEAVQRRVRVILRHAVQVEAALDRDLALAYPLRGAAIDAWI